MRKAWTIFFPDERISLGKYRLKNKTFTKNRLKINLARSIQCWYIVCTCLLKRISESPFINLLWNLRIWRLMHFLIPFMKVMGYFCKDETSTYLNLQRSSYIVRFFIITFVFFHIRCKGAFWDFLKLFQYIASLQLTANKQLRSKCTLGKTDIEWLRSLSISFSSVFHQDSRGILEIS